MNQTATADLRIDKKEQAKSLKTIQDYTDVGEYGKAIKYINLRKLTSYRNQLFQGLLRTSINNSIRL